MSKEQLPHDDELLDQEDVNAEETAALSDAESDADDDLDAFLEDIGGDGEPDDDEPAEEDEEAGEADDELDAFLEDAGDGEPGEDEAPADSDGGKKGGKRTRADSRRFRYGGMAAGLTAAAVIVVVLINVLGSALYRRFPVNFDLTKDQRYTMSDETREILKNLNKNVDIKLFMEESMVENGTGQDTNLDTMLRQLGEALRQYKSLSGDKVSYEFIDLNANPAQAAQYPDRTTYDILFTSKSTNAAGEEVTRDDAITINDMYTQDSYTGEIATSEVEKVMASALQRVSSDNTPVVALLTGYEEDANTVAGIKQMLSSANYRVEEHSILGTKEFPEDAVLAIIPAPLNDYSDDAIGRLENWLINDKKYNRHLLLIANYRGDCPKLYEYVKENYQIEVTKNVVLETEPNRILGMYSTFILGDITAETLAGDAGSRNAYMMNTLQLKTTRTNSEEESKTGYSLVSFPDTTELVDITAEEQTQVKADSYPVTGVAYANDYTYYDGSERVDTHVIVSGSNLAFYSDYYSSSSNYFEQMMVNALNTITDNVDQVYIPSYTFDSGALEYTEGQARVIMMIFVVLVPLALIAGGIVVFVRRRRL